MEPADVKVKLLIYVRE